MLIFAEHGIECAYGDVYSFGILLLEMFTGKKPVDGLFSDELNLHNYAKMPLPGTNMRSPARLA
jgi:interleukin-1 receptor-associated kinase 1